MSDVTESQETKKAEKPEKPDKQPDWSTRYKTAEDRVRQLEQETKQLALDLQEAERRASGAEAKLLEVVEAEKKYLARAATAEDVALELISAIRSGTRGKTAYGPVYNTNVEASRVDAAVKRLTESAGAVETAK